MSNSVNGSTSVYSTQSTANKTTSSASSSNIGKDEFLKILASQIANQDPMNPTSSTDFIAQMAQFSSLEQMQNLSASFSSYQAYNLIGKNVLATVLNEDGTSKQIYGQVTGVAHANNTDYLEVGGYQVQASAINAVYNDSSMDGIITQAAGLIGKTIEAQVPTTDGTDGTTNVSGKVDSILVKNGLLYAKIGDTEVPVSFIKSIT